MIKRYVDHYQILGIKQLSNDAEIKDAFRQLSLIHHPDKNKNTEESNRIFRIILNAYEILSDELKRKEYDEFLRKSEYIKRFGSSDKTNLKGTIRLNNHEILEKINITLWEIDDIIVSNHIDNNSRKFILIILTFLDKWILEPYGYPDYFMEARRLERIDPREYIKTLCEKTSFKSHLPFNSINEYYYDIRRRSDKLITEYEKKAVWDKNEDQKNGLLARIIEYNNMAIHYLSYLLKNEERIIPMYEFTNVIFNYDY